MPRYSAPNTTATPAPPSATNTNPPSAVRRSRRLTHVRTRSVHFSTEPVARDVQREMEQQLQRWVQPALELLFPFGPSARGASSVRLCTRVAAEKKVVVKTVAMTLPPSRDSAAASVRSGNAGGSAGISSADLSSDLSGNGLYAPSEKDTTWSQAQLLPDASVALFDQVGQCVPHVAGVVDVFTLASMLRNTERTSQQQLSGALDEDTKAKGLVRMPKVSAKEMEMRGWAMADAAAPTATAATAVVAAPPRRHHSGSGRGSMLSFPSPPPSQQQQQPHPTVFLFARDYVESVESLDVLLQDRWGRDRLPITAMPRWAHCGPLTDPAWASAATANTQDELRRLEEHVTRWLAGRAKVEKRKRRFVEERTAAETTLRGAAVAAPVAEDLQRLTTHDAADIAWAVASALAALHRTGHAHGNVKPNNVLVQLWSAEADAGTRRKVCLTDHLLPLVPDALLEPGAVLSLPGWRSRETRGFACMKPHDASVLPHLLGGGAAGAPVSDPATYTISGNWLSTVHDDGAATAMSVEGGVDGLPDTAYEAVLLQHFLAPENVILVLENADLLSNEAPAPVAASSAAYRVWAKANAASPAADVYALGVLLWEMLVGRLPPLPAYRRVVRGADATTTAVTVENAGALPTSSVAVMLRCVMALFEARAAAACTTRAATTAGGKDARQMKRQHELSTLLHSSTAQAHLPLLLALARAEDIRVVTMDVLVRLLHTDPKHRLTLAEFRQHAFFRTYGSRRHELRKQYEAAQRAASLSARHSMRAADGRALMPRQMGALAGVVEDTARASLERSRSEATTTTTTTRSSRQRSSSSASVGPPTPAVTEHHPVSAVHASSPPARTQSAYVGASVASRAAGGPFSPHLQTPRDGVERTAARSQPDDSCFLGPASPSLTRRSSSTSNCSVSRPYCPSPVATPVRNNSFSVAAAASTSLERSPSARLRTPSVPTQTNSEGPDAALGPLPRTKTFRGTRRWSAVVRTGSVVLSPSLEATPRRSSSGVVLSPVLLSDDGNEGKRRAAQKEKDGEAARRGLTREASWVAEAMATPLLSRPSCRLAPLAPEVAPVNGEPAFGKNPLGPRRPAVRVRPTF